MLTLEWLELKSDAALAATVCRYLQEVKYCILKQLSHRIIIWVSGINYKQLLMGHPWEVRSS
jgi:hypothetical protein